MSQPFVGQIIPVAFTFAPVGWMACNGNLLSISEFDVLFTLLGTTFGGDGITTFGLPNLNGAAALGAGQGSGLPAYVIGQLGGSEAVELDGTKLASHTHAFGVPAAVGTTNTPGPTVMLASSATAGAEVYAPPATGIEMAGGAISTTGGGQAHENRQPFNVVNYIIAYAGVFPSQS